MSENTLIIGAPSLCGEDARQTLDARISGLKFPLQVLATNRMPCHLCFPYANGLYLSASAHAGSSASATFADADAFARFVTDVQAIAELNAVKVAVELDLPALTRAKTKPAAKSE
ncbi:MAG: hypothetical protein EOM21_19960 [Gammaproteobacteria bacterium]|nr:hypothetical protein [Gammaproteobacteria bacterium]